MADRVPENVEGPFFVNTDCVGCGLCVGTAPENFKMTDDESYAFVCKQPEGDAETEACVEAMGDCPSEAIGRD